MKTRSWLWPNHQISARESGALRAEHNELVNLNAQLLAALVAIEEAAEAYVTEDHVARFADSEEMQQARAAIAAAKGE